MRLATLGLFIQCDQLLLAEKKQGEIGIGMLSGPGGKVESGETPEQGLIRETLEELSLRVSESSLELCAVINFYAGGVPDFIVYVYRGELCSGKLVETVEMIPRWYPLEPLLDSSHPLYNQMFEADRHWMPRALAGEFFKADVHYRERAKGFERIEFFPFNG